MLLRQLERRDDSRARCTAGSNSAIMQPMMAITTSSSTSVNARTQRRPMLSLMPEEKEHQSSRSPRAGRELPFAPFSPIYSPRPAFHEDTPDSAENEVVA